MSQNFCLPPANPLPAGERSSKNMPIPLSRSSVLPDFPIDYLPPVIADYAKAVADNLQVRIDMPAAYALAVLALCCQQKARIRVTTTWAEELNLYVCIVADPPELKSPVFNQMIEPVKLYTAEYNKAHAAEIKTALDIRDSLITQKNALKGKPGKENEIRRLNEQIEKIDVPHFMKLITTDSTNEALVEMMDENDGSVGIMCDEGGIFDVAGGLYSYNVSNINVYLNGYDGQSIIVNRKTRNIGIPRATMTIGVFCQKSVLANIMSNRNFTGKGLTQRFIYCLPNSKVGTRKVRDVNANSFADAQNAYYQLIYSLLKLPNTDKYTYIQFTPEARQIFADYYSVIESRLAKGGEYEDNHDYFGKFAGRVLRFAGLLHLAKYQDISKPVEIETVASAITLSEYFAEQTKNVLGYEKYNDNAEQLLDKLEQMCRKKHIDTLTVRDINKVMRNRLSRDELSEAFEELEMKNYMMHIMPEKSRYNNRSLGASQLNPDWLRYRGITIGQNN